MRLGRGPRLGIGFQVNNDTVRLTKRIHWLLTSQLKMWVLAAMDLWIRQGVQTGL